MNKSFSKRLSLNIVLMVSMIFIIALAIVAVSSHKLIAEEATRSAQNMLHAAISEMELPLNTIEVSTKATAEIAPYTFGSPDDIQQLTCAMVSRNPMIVGCAIAFAPNAYPGHELFSPYCYRDSADGSIITTQLEHNGHDYTKEEWFSVPFKTRKPHWSSPYFDANGGKQFMTTYSCPIFDAEGNVQAIITADLPLKWMEAKINGIRPYEHSFASILCPNGTVLGIRDSALLRESRNIVADNKQIADIVNQMRKGNDSVMRFSDRGEVSFAVFGPLHNGWSLSIICSYRDVLERNSRMHMILILIGLVGLAGMFLLCYRSIRRLTRPITDLSTSALNMAKGDFNAALPEIHSHDEMLQLRDAFAYLQRSLTNYIAELKTTAAANSRMEGELSVARDIQLGMLSNNFPPQLHALLEPAKEVGGDLYDFHKEGNRIYFTIGDVSGKGVPAALLMAITRASLHFVTNRGMRLQDVVSAVNKSICEANSNNMFVTAFIGRLDLDTGELIYCNAGHNPIIIAPADGDAYYLKAKPNLALGIFPDFEYEDERLQVNGDAHLLLYTDGVTEAEKQDHTQFGEDRLLEYVRQVTKHDPKATAQQLTDGLYSAVRQFTGDIPQNDDITILTIQYSNPA